MFLGHVNDIKNNQYVVLNQYNRHYVLTNTVAGYKRVSNVCPHQKSLISLGTGVDNRTCNYHGYSFDIHGNGLNNSCQLESLDTYTVNSLVFSEPIDINIPYDLSYMELVESRTDIVNADYRNIVDLFLDVQHIKHLHAGVYDTIGLENISEVDWEYYTNGSLQSVKRNSETFSEHIISSEKNNSAWWLTVYPNTMIEYQPGSLFITISLGSNKVLVYKYKDSRYSDESYNINNMVWETAWKQDVSQAEILTEFTSDNLCVAKQHYRKFISLLA